MCDDCLLQLLDNLTREELTILEILKKQKCFNPQLTLDKLALLPAVKGMTDYKFTFAMSRLELIGVVRRLVICKVHKYHITPTGIKILDHSIFKIKNKQT